MPKNGGVSSARVVGTAIPDQVYDAVLVDDAMAQRARERRVSIAADVDAALGAGRDGVVDHHAVHRAPRAVAFAVVVPPVADLDDLHALGLERSEELGGGQWFSHAGLLDMRNTPAGRRGARWWAEKAGGCLLLVQRLNVQVQRMFDPEVTLAPGIQVSHWHEPSSWTRMEPSPMPVLQDT